MTSWLKVQDEHEQVEALLSPYLDGRASVQERALVERHLTSCAECAHSLATLKVTVAALREMPRVRAPRSFALPRSMARQPQTTLWLFPALRAATALAVLVFVITIAGDLFLRGPAFQAAAPAPMSAPVSVARDSAPLATQPAQAAESLSAAPKATAVEPPKGAGSVAPTQAPLGYSAPPTVAKAAPPAAPAPAAIAPPAPTEPPATPMPTAAPVAAAKSASPTHTLPAPTLAPTLSPTSAPLPSATPIVAAQPIAPTSELQSPIADRAGPEINLLRMAEIGLAVVAIALGVAAWIVYRRSR